MRNYVLFFFLAFFLSGQSLSAQSGPHKLNALLIQLDYGYSLPLQDLNNRFGNFSSVGISPVIYLHKSRITFGPHLYYHFGRQIKVDALSNIRDEYGQVIGSDTQIATVVQRMRAFQFGIKGSKILNFSKTHTVHGLEIGIAGGYLQHWVRLQDDTRTATQLLNKYSKGYDLLSGGFYVEPQLAYVWMSQNELINIKAGMKFNLAFTRSLRKYNYNTFGYDDTRRTDSFLNFFFNYALPLYFNTTGESRYY